MLEAIVYGIVKQYNKINVRVGSLSNILSLLATSNLCCEPVPEQDSQGQKFLIKICFQDFNCIPIISHRSKCYPQLVQSEFANNRMVLIGINIFTAPTI